MKKVQNMLKLKPESEKLNLSLLQIESINDLIFELFHFPNLKELDLSCNRIKTLPKDLSILATVERLDLSNNLFLDLEQVLFALNTMPKLKELNISYDPADLKHTLGFYLPKLEVINGEVIKSGGEPKIKNPIVVVQNGKLQMNKAKSTQKLINHGYLFYDEELTILRALQNTVNQMVEEQQGNPAEQSMSFVRNLNNFNQCIRKSFDYNNDITEKCYNGDYVTNADTLQPKLDYLREIIRNFDQVIREIDQKFADSAKSLIDVLLIMIETIHKQADFLNKKIFGGNNNVSSNRFSRMSLYQQGSITNDNQQQNQQNGGNFSNGEKTLLKLQITELENEINDLRRENKHVYQTLVNQNKQMLLDFAQKTRQVFKLNTTNDNLNNTKRQDQITLKGYTLNQTNQLIYDIMKSKKEYDQRPGAQKTPQETLENFLYVFFSQKYGLKDMVKVEVTTVIDRIKEFAKQSYEVEIFKKILKNEIDEKFYWYIQNLKDDIKNRISTYYKTKIKKKASLVEINNFVSEKVNNGVTLMEGKSILDLSYQNRELKKLKAKFQIYFDENSTVNDNTNKLSYNLFLEFFFAHELEQHQKHLKLLAEFYNKIDQNHDGVITRKQFLTLMEIFIHHQIECDLEEVLKEADPHDHNSITFSKIIEVLSSNFADKEKKVNLIECLNSIQIILIYNMGNICGKVDTRPTNKNPPQQKEISIEEKVHFQIKLLNLKIDSYNREVLQLEDNVKLCHRQALQSKAQQRKQMSLYYLEKKRILQNKAAKFQNMSVILLQRKDAIQTLQMNNEFAKVLKETNDILEQHNLDKAIMEIRRANKIKQQVDRVNDELANTVQIDDELLKQYEELNIQNNTFQSDNKISTLLSVHPINDIKKSIGTEFEDYLVN